MNNEMLRIYREMLESGDLKREDAELIKANLEEEKKQIKEELDKFYDDGGMLKHSAEIGNGENSRDEINELLDKINQILSGQDFSVAKKEETEELSKESESVETEEYENNEGQEKYDEEIEEDEPEKEYDEEIEEDEPEEEYDEEIEEDEPEKEYDEEIEEDEPEEEYDEEIEEDEPEEKYDEEIEEDEPEEKYDEEIEEDEPEEKYDEEIEEEYEEETQLEDNTWTETTIEFPDIPEEEYREEAIAVIRGRKNLVTLAEVILEGENTTRALMKKIRNSDHREHEEKSYEQTHDYDKDERMR